MYSIIKDKLKLLDEFGKPNLKIEFVNNNNSQHLET